MYAYIDAYSKKITSDKQALLDEANALVKPVHDKGSKGKRQIRHDEAQISLLNEATELKPIDTLP